MLSDVDSDVIDRYGVLNTLVQPDDVPFYGVPFPGFYTQCVMPRTRTIELDVPVAAGVMPRFEQMKGSDGTAIEMDSGAHMRRPVARDRAAGVD